MSIILYPYANMGKRKKNLCRSLHGRVFRLQNQKQKAMNETLEQERQLTVDQLVSNIISRIEAIEILHTAPNPSNAGAIEEHINEAIDMLIQELISNTDRLEPLIEEALRSLGNSFNTIIGNLLDTSKGIIPASKLTTASHEIHNLNPLEYYIDSASLLSKAILGVMYTNPKTGKEADDKRTQYWKNIIDSTFFENLEDLMDYKTKVMTVREILETYYTKVEKLTKETYNHITNEFQF